MNYDPKSKDPYNLIGKEIPSADGSNYGYRILGYDPITEEYITQQINWNTGESIKGASRIDVFKITYRYAIKQWIPSRAK